MRKVAFQKSLPRLIENSQPAHVVEPALTALLSRFDSLNNATNSIDVANNQFIEIYAKNYTELGIAGVIFIVLLVTIVILCMKLEPALRSRRWKFVDDDI